MGAVFGMTTCLAAQARDAPEDPVNYFIGGCASGVILGARSEYGTNLGPFLKLLAPTLIATPVDLKGFRGLGGGTTLSLTPF